MYDLSCNDNLRSHTFAKHSVPGITYHIVMLFYVYISPSYKHEVMKYNNISTSWKHVSLTLQEHLCDGLFLTIYKMLWKKLH